MFGSYNNNGTDKHYSDGMILMGKKVVFVVSFDNHAHVFCVHDAY